MGGVLRTRVGYAGGTTADPTYQSIGDHAEALQVDFDPQRVTYDDLLAVFWASHRPTHPDRASQYRSAILAADAQQLEAAVASHEKAQAAQRTTLYSQIEPLERFYLAEDYHQKYRLARVPAVLAELRAMYPKLHDFVDSTAATRANAILGGNLEASDLDAEIQGFGLTSAAQRELRLAVR